MFGKLESLRGVAACLVILFHSPFSYGDSSIAFVRHSYLFVDFFFVLSGFVIAFAYQDKIRGGMAFGDYVLLRLGRIWPLHLAVLLLWIPYVAGKQYLYAHGYGGTDQTDTANPSSLLANVLLLQAVGVLPYLSWNYPSWSISAEFAAYLFFFLATVTVDRRAGLVVPLATAALCYAFLFSLPRHDFDITYDYGFIRCIGAFCLGVVLYRIHPRVQRLLARARSITVLELSAVALVVISVVSADGGPWTIVACLASFVWMIMVFAEGADGWIGRLLHSEAARHVGVWSYSIYMLHMLIVELTSNVAEHLLHIDVDAAFGPLSLLINGALIAVTIVASRFSYIHVEKRFRDYAKAWVMRGRAARAQV